MKEAQFKEYLTAQITACASEEKRLNAEGRKDEAVFARIRGNVFDIFRTVLAAGARMAAKGQPADLLREKLDAIPKNWQESLENALAHGETEKAHIEKIKLEAAREIRERFEKIWGDAA